jgi:hypothetical protein
MLLASCAPPTLPSSLIPTATIAPISTQSDPLPTDTLDPATDTLLPTLLPTSTPTVVRTVVLDIFPLAIGSTWIYSVTLDYAEGESVIHWAGAVTETVAVVNQQGDAWVFRIERQTEPDGIPFVLWAGDYVAQNNRLYRLVERNDSLATLIAQHGEGFEWDQILAWPLATWRQWGPAEYLSRGDGLYVWVVMGQEDVETPHRTFPGCYLLALRTNPEHILLWFCPGVGVVRYEYHHHGSVRDEVWVLREFHLQQVEL